MRRVAHVGTIFVLAALGVFHVEHEAQAADVYRFGTPKDDLEAYADGTVVPHRESAIQRQRPDGSWETLGYVEIHLHRVKRDDTDIEDISAGVTVRVNPKK